SPGGKILRGATNKRLAIDRAGPPGDLAAGHGHGQGLVRICHPFQGPVVGGPGLPCFQINGTPAIFQHIRQLRRVREVRSGFQEEYTAVRVLGQTGCQNAAGGATTDDNGVVTHARSFALWSVSWPQSMLGAWAVATATIPGDARGRTRVCV